MTFKGIEHKKDFSLKNENRKSLLYCVELDVAREPGRVAHGRLKVAHEYDMVPIK